MLERRQRAQDVQNDIPARPQGMTIDDPSKLARYLLSRGGLAWFPTANVEDGLQIISISL